MATTKPEDTTINTNVNAAADSATSWIQNYIDPDAWAQKYVDATKKQYASDRIDLKNTANQYYNNLYNTQNTVMDTIRQSNAEAVASGASKGVQAANTLASILGLQNESVTGATELANESIKLAQDETAAVLEAEQKGREAATNANIQLTSILPEYMNANTARLSEAAQYFADGNYEKAAEIYNSVFNPTGNTDTSNTISATKPANVVQFDEANKDSFDEIKQWGVSKEEGLTGDAGDYIRTVLNDAKTGLIKPGDVVNFNYGNVAWGMFGGTTHSYKYLGNGQWERVKDQKATYVPKGYHNSVFQTLGSEANAIYKD